MFGPDKAYIVGPEDVTRQCPNLGHNRGYGGWRPWSARIIGMADDTNDAVFGQRAGRPALTSLGFEPAVRGLMTHMSQFTSPPASPKLRIIDDVGDRRTTRPTPSLSIKDRGASSLRLVVVGVVAELGRRSASWFRGSQFHGALVVATYTDADPAPNEAAMFAFAEGPFT